MDLLAMISQIVIVTLFLTVEAYQAVPSAREALAFVGTVAAVESPPPSKV